MLHVLTPKRSAVSHNSYLRFVWGESMHERILTLNLTHFCNFSCNQMFQGLLAASSRRERPCREDAAGCF